MNKFKRAESLLMTQQTRMETRMAQVTALWATLMTFWRLTLWATSTWESRKRWSIHIDGWGQEDLYRRCVTELANQFPPTPQRLFSLQDGLAGARKLPRLRQRRSVLEGRPCWVTHTPKRQEINQVGVSARVPGNLTISFALQADRDQALAGLEESLWVTPDGLDDSLYTYGVKRRDGQSGLSWSGLSIRARRPHTLALKAGQYELLEDRIRLHLQGEDFHVERGIPWRLGILLWGPPGTGKSSVAHVLATQLNLCLHHLPLASLEDDTELQTLMVKMQDNGDAPPLLLIEDADTYAGATSRDVIKGVTLAGLLRVLDGNQTPPGLIVIITTNHPESLDEAFLRPGRLDQKEQLGPMGQEAFERYYKFFYQHLPETPPVPPLRDGIVPAAVTEAFKRNPHDAQAGLDAIGKVCEEVDWTPTSNLPQVSLRPRPGLLLRHLDSLHQETFAEKEDDSDACS